MKKVVIVIPTYQEAETIEKLIRKIFKLLPKAYVIVVDDQSPDNTAKIVKKLLKQYSRVKLIERQGKNGRGSAVITGFKWAYKKIKPDIYIEMDADLSHEPNELKKVINQSKPNLIVFGSRYLSTSKIINWPIKRHVASRIANLLIKIVLQLPAKDNTNGYRVYQEKAIKLMLKHKFINSGYMVLSESAYLLKKAGFKFVEIPTVFVSAKALESNATIKEFFDAFSGLLKVRITINSKPTTG